jgi:lysophospholipase L1-like esterase
MKRTICILNLPTLAFLLFGCASNNSTSLLDSSTADISIVSTSQEEDSLDMSKFPNYVENIEDLEYSYGPEQLSNPFWLGNVIYNESVLLIDSGSEISGHLQFAPKKILSVRDYSLKVEYPSTSYEIQGNKIVRVNTLPFLTKENLLGENIPAPYRLVNSISNILTDYVLMAGAVYTESPFYYGNQIQVSYVYDIKDIDLNNYPVNEPKLSKSIAKLTNAETLRITGIGDSILEGCSSSAKFDHEPYMDDMLKLTKTNLSRVYDSNVVLNNISVGGTESSWGASQAKINDIKATNPDLLFLHFGVNDAGSKVLPLSYYDNMELIISSLIAYNPNIEIGLLSFASPNPNIYDGEILDKYQARLVKLGTEYKNNVVLIDVYQISKDLLKNKDYYDLTANGINHPNDYTTRVYVQAILTQLIKY